MKNYLFLSAVGVMMLAACSDDKVPLEGPETVQPGSELTLTLNSSGDGVESRANRPLNSSEAANNITAVQIRIYNPSGVDVTNTALMTGIQNPMPWSGPTDTGTPGTADHKFSKTIKLNKLSTDGTYTVVAYGYNNVLDYTISGGGAAAEAFTATLPAATNESELFAGRANFTISNGLVTNQTNEVVMKRQVAGLLGYFKNIPILYPEPTLGVPTVVAFVRVYASSHSSAFTFPSALSVNGTGNNTKTKVLEYDLSSILTAAVFGTQTTAALATGDLSVKFTIPAINAGGVQTVPNSVLSGKFLIPFAQVASTTTFTVQLESATGVVLKSWNIINSASANNKVYDVVRNYFYSIGQKVQAGNTNGGTPDPDTTSDDDNPIDLSQETVITLTVNDAWDTIYNLGLE